MWLGPGWFYDNVFLYIHHAHPPSSSWASVLSFHLYLLMVKRVLSFSFPKPFRFYINVPHFIFRNVSTNSFALSMKIIILTTINDHYLSASNSTVFISCIFLGGMFLYLLRLYHPLTSLFANLYFLLLKLLHLLTEKEQNLLNKLCIYLHSQS